MRLAPSRTADSLLKRCAIRQANDACRGPGQLNKRRINPTSRASSKRGVTAAGANADETHPVNRPQPPAELLDPLSPAYFVPDHELEAWARDTFIEDGASLLNEEHAHLRSASIGFLWTSVPNSRHGRSIVGQCELGEPRAFGKWAKARAEAQINGWFGSVPDFIITLSAPYAIQCGDRDFMALVEHELYHAGQEIDEFGQPKFRKSGQPSFAMRGHDIEAFVGVAARYGAVESGIVELLAALKSAPTISDDRARVACGTCQGQR